MPTLTVWATIETERSLRAAAAGSGTSVGLEQGRNETRSIQVLAKADGEVTNFDIAASSLRSGIHTIAASNLRVHRAKQIEVVQATHRNANDPEVGDEGTLGWYPDALIPVDHPVTGDPLPLGKTFQALPFTLPANQTHTFWVDVSVPKGTAARDYTGTLTISADGQSNQTIAISLRVWCFTLPDTATFLTDYGRPDRRMYLQRPGGGGEGLLPWTPGDWGDVSEVCNTIWAEHRLSAQTRNVVGSSFLLPQDAGGDAWDPPASGDVTDLQTHIDAYSPSVYQVDSGDTLSSGVGAHSEAEVNAYLAAQASGISSVGRSDVKFINVLADEPWGAGEDDFVNLWGPQVHDATLECNVRTSVLPLHGEDSMVGAINVWAMILKAWTVAEKAEHPAQRAEGDTFWWYNAGSGSNASGARPYWALDRDLLNYLVLIWIAWNQDVIGSHDSGAGNFVWRILRGASDPWDEPCSLMGENGTGTVAVTNGSDQVTFSATAATVNGEIESYIGILDDAGNRAIYRISGIAGNPAVGTLAVNYQGANDGATTFQYRAFNSEFVLAYPCSEAEVGYYGIVPSMRLKAIRDAVQDFEYFSLANDLGLRDEVDDIVDALVAPITPIGDGSWGWSRTAASYESGRRSIGALIAAASQRPEVAVAGEIFKHGIEPHDATFKQGSVTNLARITGSDRQPIKLSQFALGAGSSSSSGVDARATYTIYLLDDQDSDDKTPVTGHENIAIDIAAVLFDTLQIDDRWTEDDTGYNFRHVLDIGSDTAFAVAGRNYLVEYRLVPTGEQVVIVRFRFNVI